MPAAQAGYGVDPRLRTFYWHLRWGVFVGVEAGAILLVTRPEVWFVALPFVLLWAASPVLAWRMSLPPAVSETPELESQHQL